MWRWLQSLNFDVEKLPLRKIFLLGGLLLGSFLIYVIPPFSTWDAPEHYFRANAISRGEFWAQRYSQNGLGSPLPRYEMNFVYSIWNHHWEGFERSRAYLKNLERFSAEDPQLKDFEKHEFHTGIYSPLNYAALALGLKVSRALTDTLLYRYYVGVFFNLLLFLALGGLTLSLQTNLKVFYFGFFSLPFMFIQATSVSADAPSYAFSLFYSAYIVSLWQRTRRLKRSELYLLIFLSLLLALLKPNHIVLLSLLLLLIFRAPIAVLVSGFLSVGLCAFWNGQYRDVNTSVWLKQFGDPQGQMFLLKTKTYEILSNALHSICSHYFYHWREGFGNFFTIEPRIFRTGISLSYLSFAALFMSLAGFAYAQRRKSLLYFSAVEIFTSFVGFLLTYLVMWISTSQGPMVPAPLDRYFFIFMSFFLVGMSPLIYRLSLFTQKRTQWISFAGFVVVALTHLILLLNAAGLYLEEWSKL